MELKQSITIIKKILYLTYITNTGAGFSIFSNFNTMLIILSFVIIVGMIIYLPKLPKSRFVYMSFALITGGAIGNLIDRIVLGSVTDFIAFTFWPAFNFADSCITVGAIMLFIYFWKR